MTIKTYLDDPYLKEIKANIIDKKLKDNKYHVILDRTIFHPRSSKGQPQDKGTINGVEVLDVYEENKKIIHVIKDNIHGDKVDLLIDWENRFDIMQQHTGQHLLSANIYSLYSVETEALKFTDKDTSILIDKESLSNIEVRQIEYLTNLMIQSNHKITSYSPEDEDLSELPTKGTSEHKSTNCPRLIEIDGIDYSPCSGTHLSSTGELALIKIKSWYSRNNKTTIKFVCGNRAISDYSSQNDSISQISNLLSTSEDNIIKKTKSILNENYQMERELRNLKKALKTLSKKLNLNIDDLIYVEK